TTPASVTSIAAEAFAYGILTNVNISGAVTNIGQDAFFDCPDLLAITVSPTNAYYSSLGGVLFDQSQSTLIQFPGGLSGSYTIPNTVVIIGSEAFAYSALSQISI